MIQKAYSFRKIVFHVFALLSICSCKNNFDIPFPSDESEFAQPVSRPFHFSQPEKINWIVPNPDSVKPTTIEHFDLDKLPSRPFQMDEFKPLKTPMTETKFDWDSMPQNPFSLDSLPTKPLISKTTIIGAPKKIKAQLPVIKEGASAGLLQFGVDQGLPSSLVFAVIKDRNGFTWIATNNGLCRYDGENLEIYSTDQGLSNDGILSLFEDRLGRIWIGHWGGLLEVLDLKNGTISKITTSFEKFNADIYKFLEDKKGNLWITTQGEGVIIVNLMNETIKHFTEKNGLSGNYVYDLILDKNDRIWIPGSGIDIIDIKKGTITRFGETYKKGDLNFTHILEDKDGNIWVSSIITGRVSIVSLKTGTIQHLTNLQGLYGNKVWQLFEDSKGQVWMAFDSGHVCIYEPKTQRLKTLHITKGASNNFVIDFFEYPAGQIWMSTSSDGIFISNTKSVLLNQLTMAHGLSNNSPWGLFEDSKGKIWIGITGSSAPNGWVNIIDSSRGQIKSYAIGCGYNNSYNAATSFIEDDKGLIWVGNFGCNGGIDIIDQQSSIIEHIGWLQPSAVFWGVTYLLNDRNGKVWIGTENTIRLFDRETKTVKHIGESEGFKGGWVNSILEDEQGQVWIAINTSLGKEGGIYIIDANRETIKHLTTAEGLSDNSIQSLIEGEKGFIWAATLKGIDVIDTKTKTIMTFTALEGLADNSVYTLTEKNGNIYAGTENGLTVITPPAQNITTKAADNKKGKWTAISFGKTQGFPDVNFSSNTVLQTRAGELWMNTVEIINIIHEPEKDTMVSPVNITGINIFDKPQSFITDSWIQNRTDNADTLWNAKNDTFFTKTTALADTGYLIQHHITRDSLTETFHLPVNLVLPYDQNFIGFNFTGLHFDNRDKTRYRYVLEGADKGWSAITSNPFSDNYRDLAPGNYIFKVTSKGLNGLWSKPAEFRFTILPPWWKTWWAYTLYILSFIIGLWSFIKWRERILKREKIVLENKVELRTHELKKEKEKVESTLTELKVTQSQLIEAEKKASIEKSQQAVLNERLRIGRELHDEVGATLSGIAMYSHLAKEQIKKATATEVEKSLNIMQQSAGAMVNKLNDIVWLINPDQDSLQKLIQRLEEYSRDMAAIKNMQVQINVPEHLHEHSLPMESRRNIYLFCKEAINNAVKYSNGTLLELNIKEANHTLEFSVSDNGKGFDAVMIKRGNGLENMQKRADEVGAKLTVQSKQGEGSLVSMQLKITH